MIVKFSESLRPDYQGVWHNSNVFPLLAGCSTGQRIADFGRGEIGR